MKGNFKYLLRFALIPNLNENERVEKLLKFCDEAKIDEIMFFINAEEYSSGHVSKEEALPYLQAINRVKPMLEKRGIRLSLNPWTTLSHGDRGRKLKKGQKFNLMTDWKGRVAEVTVCPFCLEWQEYIIDLWKFYIDEIKPNSLWIEDDFRLTNHSPLFFGGCFCDKHMKLYRDALKNLDEATITPTEFAHAILSPGEPSKERHAYLLVNRQGMNNVANSISLALPADINLGLMTSSPQIYMIEGRNQSELFQAIRGKRPFIFNRVYLTAYLQCSPQKYGWDFNTISTLSAFLSDTNNSGNVKIYPEIENFPHSPFCKSASFTRFQIETCAALGSDGVTLNIFDFSGNGAREDWNYNEMLKSLKPYMNGIHSVQLEKLEKTGVSTLVDEDAVFNIRTEKGETPWELYSRESWWAGYLSLSGITYRYNSERIPTGKIVAISGQYLRNRTKNEIDHIFLNNFVLLDGSAVECLVALNLGNLAGINSYELFDDNGGEICYEECEEGYSPNNIQRARVSAQGYGAFCKINYTDAVKKEICTSYYGFDGKRKADGITVVDGRICIYPHIGILQENEGIAPIRASVLRDILLKQKNTDVLAIDAELATPYLFMGIDEDYLLIINFSDDARHNMSFRSAKTYVSAKYLNRRGVWRKANFIHEGNLYKLSIDLKGVSTALICLKIFN